MRALLVLLLCSACLNILLARQIDSLNKDILYIKAEMRAMSELKVDEPVPTIEARDINGQPATIAYSEDQRPTIIYVFTPSCVWCTRNLQNVKAVFQNTSDGYRFIGLSLSKEGLPEYILKHDITFPIYNDLSPHSASSYKLGGTPRTLVISPEGRVLKSWFGAYSGPLAKEVEEYFSIRLPGIIQDQAEQSPDKEECKTCEDDKRSGS